MSWPYAAVAALANRQQGQVARRQLVRMGVGRGAIRYGLRCGRIVETFYEVYAPGGRALPALWREMGATLTCGDGAFVNGRASLVAWGVWSRPEPLIDVTVPYDRNPRRAGVRLHRRKGIDRRDVTELDGVPVATPAFALFEIATDLTFDDFERAFDDALTKRVMRLAEAQDTLARHASQPGARLYSEFALPEHGLQITASRAEQLMKAIIRPSGLSMPESNIRRGRIIPDFYWRGEKVIVEIDGYRTHGTRRAFEADRARDAKLAAEGWIVIRFTWRQLENEPALVLTRLAQTLAIRRAA
jgi:very-short-patch-repair endonuclease